jgi:hypothetical protein
VENAVPLESDCSREFMIMKNKWAIGVVLAVFLVTAMSLPLQGVDMSGINQVRDKKALLDDGDKQIIDGFIAEAVNELVKTRDFTSVSKIRRDILACRSSRVQYAEQFSVSAHKHISEALKAADGLTPEVNRFRVVMNLLILIDGLEDLRLVDLTIARLNDESEVVRYWAVHALTNSGIRKQLNSTDESGLQTARRIVEELKKIVEKSEPETMELMAKFAVEINTVEGEELLLDIADVRIKDYAEWTAKYPLLDETVLELLCKKMLSVDAGPKVGRRFGQLYSYAIQKYIRYSEEDFLSAEQKQQLESVLIETEQSCIPQLLEPQSTIRKAVSSGDYEALQDEHNRLLGEKGRAGVLALKFNFDYGRNPDGSGRTAPLVLPSRPDAEKSE